MGGDGTNDIQWRDWHEVVHAIVRAWPPGRLLDIPTKEGALPSRLRAEGFQCFCGDISAHLLKTNSPMTVMDLNRPFPFRDECFDYVTFIEGIEHLERPFDAVGEVARVLKPGGRLVITTPNVLNLRSRWRFLLSGYHLRFHGISKGGHILALSYRELQYFLASHGLDIDAITTDRVRRKVWPLHKLLKWITGFYTRRDNQFAEVITSDTLTDGRTIIIVARKRPANLR